MEKEVEEVLRMVMGQDTRRKVGLGDLEGMGTEQCCLWLQGQVTVDGSWVR